MAERSWTKPQHDAITAIGGSVLVSAAAGSGKTAVLVERAIRLICDPDNPVSADRLLVVTFSNAAAAEMKQRMGARLSAMIQENPADLYLQRQQTLLAGAQISTIHSFCLELIRQNFQNLEVSPDFSIADQNELELLKADCARDCIEQFYARDESGVFAELVELLSSGRDDSKLLETILKIYEFSRSHPFFEDWLDEKLGMYDSSLPVAETVWGQSILRYACESLRYCVSTEAAALDIIQGDEKMQKAYAGAFASDLAQIEACLTAAVTGDWDETVERLAAFKFEKLGPLRGEDSEKQQVKAARDRVKKIVQDLSGKYINATGEDFRQDIDDLYPKIAVLFQLVLSFAVRLDAAKGEKKRLDFSDLEHLALRLLVEKTADGYRRTTHAEEIAARYDHVLVDEYQDTNEVQDMIFSSVSRGQQNLFMVGDVKQSIYSFRQAMPEIFMAKKERFFPYDTGNFPAKIILDTNFRSRTQVTQGVNFLFGMLMSTQMGEIDYNDEESLKCGAQYPDYTPASPELLVIGSKHYDGEQDTTAIEAGEIGKKIRGMIDGGYLVEDHGSMRPATPRDFCILLRSPKNRADVYVKELARHGVPAWAESANGYLIAREVSAVIASLKALDNPLLDVELVAAMLSPLFDFTDDDIAKIRLCRRGVPFYTACLQYAEEGDERTTAFLRLFDELRVDAAVLPADKLLMRLYERTDALAVVQAMPMGQARAANLLLLIEYAATYHQMGYKRLGGFVGFLSRMEEKGGDLAPANTLGDGANVVRIMSVHRSKGLEFPIVFLADTAKSFNKMDLRSNTLLHSKYGFACVRRDNVLFKQYATVPMQAIRLESQRSLLSEEMRILYVALTRAKEKLIVTCLQKGELQKKLSGLYIPPEHAKLPPYVVGEAASYADWLLMALLHHPSCNTLRDTGRCEDTSIVDDGNPWIVTINEPTADNDAPAQQEQARTAKPDPQLLAELQRRVEFVYPYESHTIIPTKLAVSAVAKGAQSAAYRFSARPKFLSDAALTPTEKGNAIHKFMQFADYQNARDDLAKEIERMGRECFLSASEVTSLDKGKLKKFFSSKLAGRIFASKEVFRELRFMAECGKDILGDMVEGLDNSGKVVLQGVADCVFIEDGAAVIVDYKSDHVDSPAQLKERYEAQLRLYRRILADSLGVAVSECVLYSFGLSLEITV